MHCGHVGELFILALEVKCCHTCVDDLVDQVEKKAAQEPLLIVFLIDSIAICLQHVPEHGHVIGRGCGGRELLCEVDLILDIMSLALHKSQSMIYILMFQLSVQAVILDQTSASLIVCMHFLLVVFEEKLKDFTFLDLCTLRASKHFFAFVLVVCSLVIFCEISMALCYRLTFLKIIFGDRISSITLAFQA